MSSGEQQQRQGGHKEAEQPSLSVPQQQEEEQQEAPAIPPTESVAAGSGPSAVEGAGTTAAGSAPPQHPSKLPEEVQQPAAAVEVLAGFDLPQTQLVLPTARLTQLPFTAVATQATLPAMAAVPELQPTQAVFDPLEDSGSAGEQEDADEQEAAEAAVAAAAAAVAGALAAGSALSSAPAEAGAPEQAVTAAATEKEEAHLPVQQQKQLLQPELAGLEVEEGAVPAPAELDALEAVTEAAAPPLEAAAELAAGAVAAASFIPLPLPSEQPATAAGVAAGAVAMFAAAELAASFIPLPLPSEQPATAAGGSNEGAGEEAEPMELEEAAQPLPQPGAAVVPAETPAEDIAAQGTAVPASTPAAAAAGSAPGGRCDTGGSSGSLYSSGSEDEGSDHAGGGGCGCEEETVWPTPLCTQDELYLARQQEREALLACAAQSPSGGLLAHSAAQHVGF